MSQYDRSKKYEEKFKSLRLRFTPEQMQDLTAYCERHEIPKSTFCVDLALKTVYGGKIERSEFFADNAFLAKAKLVLKGESKVFKEWSEHSTITKENFLTELCWLCEDPLDSLGRCTRAIGLAPDGIIRLMYSRNCETTSICRCEEIFSGSEIHETWQGETFTRPAVTEKEKKLFGDSPIKEHWKIFINCKDRV